MPNQRPKIYDQAANEALELNLDLRDFFTQDGRLNHVEQRLLSEARRVCAYTDATATCARVGQRMSGGGALDKNLERERQDSIRLLRECAPRARTKGIEESQQATDRLASIGQKRG